MLKGSQDNVAMETTTGVDATGRDSGHSDETVQVSVKEQMKRRHWCFLCALKSSRGCSISKVHLGHQSVMLSTERNSSLFTASGCFRKIKRDSQCNFEIVSKEWMKKLKMNTLYFINLTMIVT